MMTLEVRALKLLANIDRCKIPKDTRVHQITREFLLAKD